MKSATALALALTFVVGAGALGAETADAFGGHKGKHRGYNHENALVPLEMRQEWREERRAMLADMTDEERQEYREEKRTERQERREERKEAFEDFVGLDREEIKERKQSGDTFEEILEEQGIDEEDAENFLTDRANDHVDDLVERHDLDSTDEATLRDRVESFVESILERWFKTS